MFRAYCEDRDQRKLIETDIIGQDAVSVQNTALIECVFVINSHQLGIGRAYRQSKSIK